MKWFPLDKFTLLHFGIGLAIGMLGRIADAPKPWAFAMGCTPGIVREALQVPNADPVDAAATCLGALLGTQQQSRSEWRAVQFQRCAPTPRNTFPAGFDRDGKQLFVTFPPDVAASILNANRRLCESQFADSTKLRRIIAR